MVASFGFYTEGNQARGDDAVCRGYAARGQ